MNYKTLVILGSIVSVIGSVTYFYLEDIGKAIFFTIWLLVFRVDYQTESMEDVEEDKKG